MPQLDDVSASALQTRCNFVASLNVRYTQDLSCYYTLAIEPTLFSEIAVVRQLGRIGKRGGEKSENFATERDAAIDFLMLAREKR